MNANFRHDSEEGGGGVALRRHAFSGRCARVLCGLLYFAAIDHCPFHYGVLYKGESAGYIQSQIAELIGNNAAKVITGTIESVSQSRNGSMATALSVLTLFLGASGVFVQLQSTLNRIWKVTPQPGRFFRDLLKQRLVSFAMVVAVGFLLLTSLLLSAALAALNGYFNYLLPQANALWYAIDIILSLTVITLIFAAIFKIVPDVDIRLVRCLARRHLDRRSSLQAVSSQLAFI